MSVSNPLSYTKNLKYLSAVAKKPFVVDGVHYSIPREVKLSPTFWRKYGCYLGCGACCPSFTLDYIPSEWLYACNLHHEIEERGKRVEIKVNGEHRIIYSIKQSDENFAFGKAWCDYVDMRSGECTIHPSRPISCRIELIKFPVVNDIAYISKRFYGRAWLLKRCVDGGKVLCDMKEFSREQYYDNDLYCLTSMRNWADYLGIETHLSEIISFTKEQVRLGSYGLIKIRNS